MNDLQYYTKEINDCRETQCQSDLLNGKIKITDVPFAFRGHDEYTAAHKYARGLVDEKERYYLYWKIAECMESDMVNLQAAVDWKQTFYQGTQAPSIATSVNLATFVV